MAHVENPWAKPAATAAATTRDLFRLTWWWLPRPTRQELASLLGGDAAEVIKKTEEGEAEPPATAHVDQVTLRDGTKAWLRPILPSDRQMHREGFARLSDDSKFQRFVSPIPRLSETMLDQLVDSVDGVDHIAYYLFVEEWPELPVGIGRIVRYPDDPEVADIAVTVQDDWQGRGIATALVAFLVERRPKGVVRLETVVADENPASLALLKRIGPAQITSMQGVNEVRIELDEERLAHIAANAGMSEETEQAGVAADSQPRQRRPRHRLRHELLQLDQIFLAGGTRRILSELQDNTTKAKKLHDKKKQAKKKHANQKREKVEQVLTSGNNPQVG